MQATVLRTRRQLRSTRLIDPLNVRRTQKVLDRAHSMCQNRKQDWQPPSLPKTSWITVLTQQQQLYAKVVFEAQFADLYEDAFQDYFQKLMQYRYPTFLPVRTHGNIGDQGSDGLCTLENKLFACYGPHAHDDKATSKKFRVDLASSLIKRPGQFTTFVFVHNDRRGMHPKIATELVEAKHNHPALTFEQMGKVAIWREFMRLELPEAQDMLGQAILVQELVYGIGLADLDPLLAHLSRNRNVTRPAQAVPMHKIEFNGFSLDNQHYLVHGMRFAKQIKDYYQGLGDPNAEDETAIAFRERYSELRALGLTPDEILHELFIYVSGTMVPDSARLTSTYTILSYFCQRCDIFDEPPDDYVHTVGGGT